ncbi:MAG: hypothetical protein KQH63_15175 [Desulfobulbaceae bacterium]|nr:hypothetical protein [Desulfobulbaceae bacterium]
MRACKSYPLSSLMMRIILKLTKKQKTALGCFTMLAIGTGPTLFSNPLEYFLGLGFCLFASIAIAHILL